MKTKARKRGTVPMLSALLRNLSRGPSLALTSSLVAKKAIKVNTARIPMNTLIPITALVVVVVVVVIVVIVVVTTVLITPQSNLFLVSVAYYR